MIWRVFDVVNTCSRRKKYNRVGAEPLCNIFQHLTERIVVLKNGTNKVHGKINFLMNSRSACCQVRSQA